MRSALGQVAAVVAALSAINAVSGLLVPLAIVFCVVAIRRDRGSEHSRRRHPATAGATGPPPRRRVAFPFS